MARKQQAKGKQTATTAKQIPAKRSTPEQIPQRAPERTRSSGVAVAGIEIPTSVGDIGAQLAKVMDTEAGRVVLAEILIHAAKALTRNVSRETLSNAGIAVADASRAVVDAGTAAADAGKNAAMDAGAAAMDVGKNAASAAMDAGAAVVDAGKNAASAALDAGAAAMDAGKNAASATVKVGKQAANAAREVGSEALKATGLASSVARVAADVVGDAMAQAAEKVLPSKAKGRRATARKPEEQGKGRRPESSSSEGVAPVGATGSRRGRR